MSVSSRSWKMPVSLPAFTKNESLHPKGISCRRAAACFLNSWQPPERMCLCSGSYQSMSEKDHLPPPVYRGPHRLNRRQSRNEVDESKHEPHGGQFPHSASFL